VVAPVMTALRETLSVHAGSTVLLHMSKRRNRLPVSVSFAHCQLKEKKKSCLYEGTVTDLCMSPSRT